MKKFLLICGIISSLLYIGTDLLAAKLWEGYSAASQMVSEFIAINAPTRPLVVVLFFIYSLLIFAFGAGVWLSAEKKTALRLTAVGLIGKEVLGVVVTLFFPIHLRGVEGTLSDTMHGVMTMVGNLFMLMALLSAAAAFGKRFGLYSIATAVLLIIFGYLTGTYIPNVAANLPTPLMGVYERINIFAYMLWVIVLAFMVIREV
jgi:hypothetical protein